MIWCHAEMCYLCWLLPLRRNVFFMMYFRGLLMTCFFCFSECPALANCVDCTLIRQCRFYIGLLNEARYPVCLHKDEMLSRRLREVIAVPDWRGCLDEKDIHNPNFRPHTFAWLAPRTSS